jgi:hypothetical protein
MYHQLRGESSKLKVTKARNPLKLGGKSGIYNKEAKFL